MTVSMDDIVQYLGKIETLVEQNKLLNAELTVKENLIKSYREAAKERNEQYANNLANHRGALKRQQDEIHVLYHKISNLVDDYKPDNYYKMGEQGKREWLQQHLDKLEPKDLSFVGGRVYSLTEFGNKPWQDVVGGNYSEQQMMLC